MEKINLTSNHLADDDLYFKEIRFPRVVDVLVKPSKWATDVYVASLTFCGSFWFFIVIPLLW